MRIIRVWEMNGRDRKSIGSIFERDQELDVFPILRPTSPNRSARTLSSGRARPVNETTEKTRKSRTHPDETCKDPIKKRQIACF
jgi:hypothetical protein